MGATEIGPKEITINRENLAALLYKIKTGGNPIPQADILMLMEECYLEADAIISNLSELLEAK